MRRTRSLTVAGLLALALLAPATGPSAAAETCLGRTATIVGTGPSITGTDGRDVIVTGTADTVDALEGDDLVCVSGPDDSPRVLTIRMGAGNDEVIVEPADVVATGSRLDAGPGRDLLVAAQREGRQAVNLGLERWLLDSRIATVAGFEDVTLVAPSVRVLGDDEPNTFSSTSCFAKLDGNGGDDYLANRPRSYFEAYTFDCVASSRMHGGSGADRLVDSHGTGALHGGPGHDSLLGRGGEDQLDGGRGRDRADGCKGRDRCAAERERRCER
jgi:Ca2+-binding RTX toxin-like protein